MTRLKGFLAATAAFASLVSAAQGQGKARPGFKIDSVSNEEFRAYLRTLSFSPDSESGDRQALLVGHYPDSAQLGPLATILPEERSHLISAVEFSRGRVIARINNESADTYPKLGLLPHAATYWWVEFPQRGDSGRSVFVAVDADSNIISRVIRGLEIYRYHKSFRVMQPLARFVWTEADDLAWGSCGGACCKSQAQD